MTKRRVDASRPVSSCHDHLTGSESSDPASSGAVPVPTPSDEASTSTGEPKFDLDGFDLTDFARFLREVSPDWVAGVAKPSPVGRSLKR